MANEEKSRRRVRFPRPWLARALAALSGALLAAAFPPLNAWPLALAWAAPLLLAVWFPPVPPAVRPEAGSPPSSPAIRARVLRRAAGWRGFRLGWLSGFVHFGATLWWIGHVTAPGVVALCAYLALYPAVFAAAAGWLGMAPREGWRSVAGKILLLAALQAGLEYARATVLYGFSWNGPAIPLFPLASLRAAASVTGAQGLCVVSAAVSLLLAAVTLRPRGERLRPALAVAGLALLFTLAETLERVRLSRNGAVRPAYSALLLQPNVNMADKMSPDPAVQRARYDALIRATLENLPSDRELAERGLPPLALVVWPESAIPEYFHVLMQIPAVREDFDAILRRGNFTLVTGADEQRWRADGDYTLHNSFAALRGAPDNHALHGKVQLVPFGEFIPLREELPFLERMLGDLIPVDFARGDGLEPLRLGDQPFSMAPLVCFEDTIADHARRYVRPEPQVLVNITNDNWFHESPGAAMHFANARWRAAELRRALLRSANTGVTGVVHPDGTASGVLPPFTESASLVAFDAGTGEITFYAKHGELFSQTCGALALPGLAAAAMRRRRRESD